MEDQTEPTTGLPNPGIAPFKAFTELDEEAKYKEVQAMYALAGASVILNTPIGKKIKEIHEKEIRLIGDFSGYGIPEDIQMPLTGAEAIVNYYESMGQKYQKGEYTLEEYKRDLGRIERFSKVGGIDLVGIEAIHGDSGSCPEIEELKKYLGSPSHANELHLKYLKQFGIIGEDGSPNPEKSNPAGIVFAGMLAQRDAERFSYADDLLKKLSKTVL